MIGAGRPTAAPCPCPLISSHQEIYNSIRWPILSHGGGKRFGEPMKTTKTCSVSALLVGWESPTFYYAFVRWAATVVVLMSTYMGHIQTSGGGRSSYMRSHHPSHHTPRDTPIHRHSTHTVLLRTRIYAFHLLLYSATGETRGEREGEEMECRSFPTGFHASRCRANAVFVPIHTHISPVDSSALLASPKVYSLLEPYIARSLSVCQRWEKLAEKLVEKLAREPFISPSRPCGKTWSQSFAVRSLWDGTENGSTIRRVVSLRRLLRINATSIS
jgi:hypothetical protein